MFLKFYIFSIFFWWNYVKIAAVYASSKERTLAKYTASIRDASPNGKGHICAGAIIGSRSVVTSATCVHDKKPKEIVIIHGTPNLMKKAPSQPPLTVRYIRIHQGFVPGEIPQNNLATIRVWKRIRVDRKTIEWVFVPRKRPLAQNDRCTLVGWGGQKGNELQYANLVVFNNDRCELPLAPQTFCAGDPTHDVRNAGLCDEGGALFCFKDKMYGLYGIVNAISNCTEFGPTYFTDIHQHYGWFKIQSAGDRSIYLRSSAQRQIINSFLLQISIILFIFVNFLLSYCIDFITGFGGGD